MPLEIVNRTKAAGCMQNNGEVWVSVASFSLRSAADACSSETAFETFAGRPAAITVALRAGSLDVVSLSFADHLSL